MLAQVFEQLFHAHVPGRQPLHHHQLRAHIEKFDLSSYGIYPGDVCSVMLPNGPELGLCLLSCMTVCVCAPINPQGNLSLFRVFPLDSCSLPPSQPYQTDAQASLTSVNMHMYTHIE